MTIHKIGTIGWGLCLVIGLLELQPLGAAEVVEVLEILLQLPPAVGGQLGHICPPLLGSLGD